MMNSSMHEQALCHSSASKGSARTGDLGFNHFDEIERMLPPQHNMLSSVWFRVDRNPADANEMSGAPPIL
jgi:hypothetical protein